MNNNQLSYEYNNISDNGEDNSGGSFVLFFIVFILLIIGGIIYIPMILNGFWTLGLGVLIIIGSYIRYHICMNNNVRAFFDNTDNHTHDNDCYTCGNIFGPKYTTHHPHVRKLAYVCRHESGNIDYRL